MREQLREQLRDEHGKTGKLSYHFYDTLVIPEDTVLIDQLDTVGEQNSSSQPLTGFPYTAQPYTVNPTQLNTNSNKGLKVSNISSSSSSSLKQLHASLHRRQFPEMVCKTYFIL